MANKGLDGFLCVCVYLFYFGYMHLDLAMIDFKAIRKGPS